VGLISILMLRDLALIVPAPEADRVAEIMRQAFLARFPDANCEVRVKSSLKNRRENELTNYTNHENRTPRKKDVR
jgi:hypothetical protein